MTDLQPLADRRELAVQYLAMSLYYNIGIFCEQTTVNFDALSPALRYPCIAQATAILAEAHRVV